MQVVPDGPPQRALDKTPSVLGPADGKIANGSRWMRGRVGACTGVSPFNGYSLANDFWLLARAVPGFHDTSTNSRSASVTCVKITQERFDSLRKVQFAV